METRYSNPEYLKNIIPVLLDLNTYTHIVFTSFLGVSIIKLLSLFTNPEIFISQFTTLNEKTLEYINNYLLFSWTKLFFVLSITLLLLRYSTTEKES